MLQAVHLFMEVHTHQRHIVSMPMAMAQHAASSFEDNAEYGYGMNLGVAQVREKLQGLPQIYQQKGKPELKDLSPSGMLTRMMLKTIEL